MFIGAVLLYIALAAGFYVAIIATAKEMPDEVGEPMRRDERERSPAVEEAEAERHREHTMRLAS